MPKIKIISSVPIHKGWSCDEKYCVTAEDGKRYLLRVTPKSKNANTLTDMISGIPGRNLIALYFLPRKRLSLHLEL